MRRLVLALMLAASPALAWSGNDGGHDSDLPALSAALVDPTFDVELELRPVVDPRAAVVNGALAGLRDAEWHALDAWGLAEEGDPCAAW